LSRADGTFKAPISGPRSPDYVKSAGDVRYGACRQRREADRLHWIERQRREQGPPLLGAAERRALCGGVSQQILVVELSLPPRSAHLFPGIPIEGGSAVARANVGDARDDSWDPNRLRRERA
jgi:hypothetical protein